LNGLTLSKYHNKCDLDDLTPVLWMVKVAAKLLRQLLLGCFIRLFNGLYSDFGVYAPKVFTVGVITVLLRALKELFCRCLTLLTTCALTAVLWVLQKMSFRCFKNVSSGFSISCFRDAVTNVLRVVQERSRAVAVLH
jgi:hypothetical protein